MTDLSFNKWVALSDQALCKTIGDFIKLARLKSNITQEELALQANISRSTLSQLERGKTVTILTLLQVLRVLDLLYIMEVFQVNNSISPLALAKIAKKNRLRATSNK